MYETQAHREHRQLQPHELDNPEPPAPPYEEEQPPVEEEDTQPVPEVGRVRRREEAENIVPQGAD